MYKLKEIADKVYYVGVNDRQKALFENMWPLPYGVSYNSYLIVDEKTVLIDTVDVCYSDIFLKKVADALDGRSLDYLVVNHMEPDHAEVSVCCVSNIRTYRLSETIRLSECWKDIMASRKACLR